LGKFSGSRPPVEFGQRLQVHIALAANIDESDPPPLSPSPKRGVGNASVPANGPRGPQPAGGYWLAVEVAGFWHRYHRPLSFADLMNACTAPGSYLTTRRLSLMQGSKPARVYLAML
jgi:hypothetical protein